MILCLSFLGCFFKVLTVELAPASVRRQRSVKGFFYNDAGFLLALAIVDDPLFGYETLDDVRKQEIPPGQDELVLRFKSSALERPILQRCTKTGGVTDDPMSKVHLTRYSRAL